MARRISRREFHVLFSGACAASALAGSLGSAQAQSTVSLESSLLDKLDALERRAGISIPAGRSAPRLSPANVYLQSMPRLVDVLDAAEQKGDAQLAADAAAALSDLNAQEKAVPDFLRPSGRAGAAPRFEALKAEYRSRFQSCVVRSERRDSVAWHLGRLKKNKDRYVALANETNVPWYFIGIVHALEASFNFGGHLHNGDPLTAKTYHVPKNRPAQWLPPSDWKSSAKDALEVEGFLGQSDWSMEMMLYRWERYNGFGYRRPAVALPSPYLWSFSTHYRAGKYIGDNQFSATAVSQQCGAAVMLKALVNDGAVTV